MQPTLGFAEQYETERAILRAVLYSDIFDYPLTTDEIAHYLAGVTTDGEKVRAILAAPVWLDGQIARVNGYITARGREILVDRRRERKRTSDRLWRHARFFARMLSCLPFVRMVAVTGALAVDNSVEGDDVDMLIVTAQNRVWLARMFAIAVVHVGRLAGSILCPNYVISEKILSLEPRTLFVAHEFVQMVPLYGFEIYDRMRAANRWIEGMLPNAREPYHREPEQCPGRVGLAFKRIAECMLSGCLGDRIERWEMNRKICKFTSKLGESGGSVVLNRDQVKGHFKDHGPRIIRLYGRKLEEFQLTEQDVAQETPY